MRIRATLRSGLDAWRMTELKSGIFRWPQVNVQIFDFEEEGGDFDDMDFGAGRSQEPRGSR